ncbi:chondroitin AC/alginate lyase [Epithele typhae]|uniref:chondroitin AC/alginate lyase n=1 Tax=Epithele typhae TaxID=378194 RepID=UPI002007EB4B|nr:chondroitin AC/alginate lyase [Epithele typhae]KAH9944487.1 chondroitin AC/alginate lyase [Epithele typhae]
MALLMFAAPAGLVAADPNDWVGVDYVTHLAASDPNTAQARRAIVSEASSSAKAGPWSVTQSKILPPSGDVRDYYSWAPYHWPNCNFCSKGTNHLSGPGRSNQTTADSDSDPGDSADGDPAPDDGGDVHEDGGITYDPAYNGDGFRGERRDLHDENTVRSSTGRHRRMVRKKRQLVQHLASASDAVPSRSTASAPTRAAAANIQHVHMLIPTSVDDPTNIATATPTSSTDGTDELPDLNDLPPLTSTTPRGVAPSAAPAQAAAKTSTQSKCTPSPTTKMAPSATWTTCPYVVRDGKVNPDVRDLRDSGFARTSKAFSATAAKLVDAFFLSPKTGMNPNMNFGQLVRGPGRAHQIGSWTGILDMRGLVKVVNAIEVLKGVKSADWTTAREKAMMDWMKSYASWLENSALGKEVASKANNHYTFFVSQLAAAKLYRGDIQGAQRSGEQPFEAVRTRPYHYRAFNLEAMITNAKLGDALGLDFWTAKSKRGATIQDALDFAMRADPKGERVSDLVPHVAAVAAAYGDPKGKYRAFLQKADAAFEGEPFWLYDQPAAVPHSPAGRAAAKKKTRSAEERRGLGHGLAVEGAAAAQGSRLEGRGGAAPPEFECPAVFEMEDVTELEVGLFVTCDQLKPYYEITLPGDSGKP